MFRFLNFLKVIYISFFFIYFSNCASEEIVPSSPEPPISETKRIPDPFGNIILQESSNKQRLFLTQTNQTLEMYDTYQPFENGYIVSSGNRYSILSRNGNKLITNWCDEIVFLAPNILKMKVGGKVGIFFENRILILPEYEHIELENGMYKVNKDNKIGIIDSNGKLLLNPIFDSIELIDEIYYLVEYEKEKGLYDSLGNLLIPINYDTIDKFKEDSFRVSKDGDYGLVDKNGKEIFPLVYDYFSELENDFIILKNNNIYDIYNLDFTKINSTPLEYISENIDEFIYFKESGKWGAMDKKGNIFITPRYQYSIKVNGTGFNNLYYLYREEEHSNGEKVYTETRIGIIDNKGNEILYPNYRNLNLEVLSEDLYKISETDNEDRMKFGILNSKFRTSSGIDYDVIEPISDTYYLLGYHKSTYEDYSLRYKLINAKTENMKRIGDNSYTRVYSLPTNLFFVCLENGGCGIINQDSKFTIQPNKTNLMFRIQGNDPIAFEINEKWGFITRDDKILVSPKYDEVKLFENGIAIVRLGERWGAIQESGKVVTRIKYKEIGNTFENYLSVKLGEFWSLLDTRKGIVLKGEFEDLQIYGREKRVVTKTEDSFQIFNLDTKERLKDKIDFLDRFENGIAITGKTYDSSELRFGLMDTSGKLILPPKYEKLAFLGDGIYSYKENNFYGIIDSSGKRIIRPTYSEIEYFDNNKFLVKNENKVGLIDKVGKILLPLNYNRIDAPINKKIRVVSNDSCMYLDENFQILKDDCNDYNGDSTPYKSEGIFNSYIYGR